MHWTNALKALTALAPSPDTTWYAVTATNVEQINTILHAAGKGRPARVGHAIDLAHAVLWSNTAFGGAMGGHGTARVCGLRCVR